MVEEWREFSTDAGLTKLSDQGALRRWVVCKEVAGASPDARASTVLDLLLERGISVPAKVQAEVAATLRAVGDQGDVTAQSTSSVAVCILYTGDLPGVEMVDWHTGASR